MRLPLLSPTFSSSSWRLKRTFNRFSNNLSLRRNYGGSWRKCSNGASDTPAKLFSFPLLPESGKCFHQQCRTFLTAPVLHSEEMVDVTFITNDGKKHKTKGKIGDNLLDVVVNNSVDLDGFGACEGTLACSTCHLVFKKKDFDKITDKITDEELDMLDLAYGLTDTSRLGCQVTLSKALAGVEVEVPAGVNDQRS